MEIKDRKEYRYQIIFDVLRDHDIFLDHYEQDTVINFIRGLDYVDQIQDLKPERNFYEEALGFVSGEKELDQNIPKNVRNNFTTLGLYILKTNQIEALKMASRTLFKRRRLRCNAKNIEDYLDFSLKEADSYSRVSFLFLPKEKLTEKAKEIFVLGQRLVRILDNLIDLKEDYANGQLVFKPNWKLKAMLRAEMLFLIFKLVSIYPKKTRGIKIAKRYIKRFFVPSWA